MATSKRAIGLQGVRVEARHLPVSATKSPRAFVMASRSRFGVMGIGLAILVLAGCGGAPRTAPRPVAASASPGSKAAGQIRKRLEKAGYDTTPGAAPIGPTIHPKKPSGEVATFDIEVDFTSPRSFHLYIAVFQTHADALRYLSHSDAERRTGIARCRAILRCRITLEGASNQGLYGIERVIGQAFYSASPDQPNATIAPSSLNQILALASGIRSG